MTLLSLAAYAADVLILTAYFLLSRNAKRLRLYNFVNFVTAPALVAVEVVAHAWQPLVLSASFGLIALYGLVKK